MAADANQKAAKKSKLTEVSVLDEDVGKEVAPTAVEDYESLARRLCDFRLGAAMIGELRAYADAVTPVDQAVVDQALQLLTTASTIQYDIDSFDTDCITEVGLTFAGIQEFNRLSTPIKPSDVEGVVDGLQYLIDHPEVFFCLLAVDCTNATMRYLCTLYLFVARV